MHHRVAYIRGGPDDESGPELADAAMAVVNVLLGFHGSPAVTFAPVEAGASCYRTHGTSLPAKSLRRILEIGAVLKAPTASAKAPDDTPVSMVLRRALDTFASVNYFRSYDGVATALRPDIDTVLVRDNSEGLFAGHTVLPRPGLAVDIRLISRESSLRVARIGFDLARQRRKKVAVCAFPVVVKSDRVFISACEEVAAEHPDVEMVVRKADALAGTVIADPSQYDVVVAPNEWGSILTDAFGAATGSVALAARANLGQSTGYFEPIHGTAPGKAGKGTVNPISQIMAAVRLFEWLGTSRADESATRAAAQLDQAVRQALFAGIRTHDLGGTATTAEMVEEVIGQLRAIAGDDAA